jgi:hypothetical protein
MIRTPTIFILGAGVILFITGCDDRGNEELAQLRAKVTADERRMEAMSAQIEALSQRVTQLQAKLPRPDAGKDQPVATNDAATLKQSISACVKNVRSLETGTTGGLYAGFDAYYNPGTGRVINNDQFVDQRAVYAFNKCMASKGVPLLTQ